jgi:hypothetical protein
MSCDQEWVEVDVTHVIIDLDKDCFDKGLKELMEKGWTVVIYLKPGKPRRAVCIHPQDSYTEHFFEFMDQIPTGPLQETTPCSE